MGTRNKIQPVAKIFDEIEVQQMKNSSRCSERIARGTTTPTIGAVGECSRSVRPHKFHAQQNQRMLSAPRLAEAIKPNASSSSKMKEFLAKAFILLACFSMMMAISSVPQAVDANVLMRVCDTREIKTVTNRVCMLFKRTKNSDVRLDRQGNLRITRDTKGEYSPAKLASDCCKIGCPAYIFAYNCD